jgi:steroid delta-isomerase-like uncharacterized protein
MAAAADIHREVFAAWNKRDYKKMRELLHPDYRYTGGDGKEAVGPDAGIAIGQMYAAAFPDGRVEVERVHVAGDTAVAEVVARGTHGGDLMGIAPTGKKVEIRICNVVELRDGKVYREREYMDTLVMMVQLGAVKLPGS